MAKPASGTALDTGHALYTNLTHAYGCLEGSGTTSVDSKGGNDLTLSGSGLWSSDGDGPTLVNTSNTNNSPLTPASAISFTTQQDWSMAWRAKQTSNDDNGMIVGDPSGSTNYLWMRGSSYLRFVNANSANNFTGVSTFTALDDWLYTTEYIAGTTYRHRLYQNGVEVSGSPIDNAAIGNNLTIAAIMGGFSNLALVGTLSYLYIWKDRLLTSTDAGMLDTNPYVIFTSGGGGGGLSIPVVMNQYRQRRA